MNRENFWIHLCIAVVVISFAAVLGQIERWRSMVRPFETKKSVQISVPRSMAAGEPEVLVKFKSGVSPALIEKVVAKNNDRIEDEIESVKGLAAIDDLDNADAAKVAAQYSQMTDIVEYAEPNYEIRLDPGEGGGRGTSLNVRRELSPVMPNDPLFAEQWSLNNSGQGGGKEKADINAVTAWNKTKGSKKVVVAVLDTGVDYTHTDLAANMWFRPDSVPAYQDEELGIVNDEHGFNADSNLADPMDDNGHGTHCAGIIGAEGDNDEGIAGINWDVQIMPLKFLGRGGFGSTKNAIESINYAIDRKRAGVNLRIISASWGSTAYSKALEDAIRAAGNEGILFIAAAGNDGASNDRRPHYPSNYDLPNVISVAAMDRNDKLASFSNFGNTVHIAAPGKEIVSTWLNNNFREASGTSMATPEVSGVAALILAAEPDMKVDKLKERILSSVDKLDSLNGKVKTGGRLNAAKALGE